MDFNKTNYLRKKGVYLIEVMGIIKSNEIPNYNKSPFIKFKCITEPDGAMVDLLFWTHKNGDSEVVKKIKSERINKFFEHCNAKITELDTIIGKKCKVALKQKERLVIKDGNKPMIYNDVEFWYSGPVDKPLKADESKMMIELSETDKQKYISETSKYEKEKNYSNKKDNDLDFLNETPSKKVVNDDFDLPF